MGFWVHLSVPVGVVVWAVSAPLPPWPLILGPSHSNKAVAQRALLSGKPNEGVFLVTFQ